VALGRDASAIAPQNGKAPKVSDKVAAAQRTGIPGHSGPELRATVATQQANHLNCPRNSVGLHMYTTAWGS